MDALEFAIERRRMCKALEENCKLCELVDGCCLIGYSRGTAEEDARTIDVVEKWSKEHPIKTRQTELLKLFPDVPLDRFGVVKVCPMVLGAGCGGCAEEGCDECRKKWWGKEIEEKK